MQESDDEVTKSHNFEKNCSLPSDTGNNDVFGALYNFCFRHRDLLDLSKEK